MVLLLRILALITISLSTVSVVDAISKNSSPHIPPTSSQSKNNISANTLKERDDTTSNDDDITTKKKTKGESKSISKTINITSRPKTSKSTKTKTTTSTLLNTGVSSQSSASLRRIKKEYKDAVDMGIAYDWANQRRIISKKTKEDSSSDVYTNTNNNTTAKDDQNIICLGPLTSNLRHWHFSFRGAGGEGGIYNNGIYHGLIKLSKDYPMSPPDIQVWTPSGRFKPGMDICLSASAYHPEAWTPRWSIFGMVNALRLHMLSSPNEIGAKTSTTAETLEFARLSLTWKKTWVDGTGSKKKCITVDHRLLLSQGVLSLQSDNDDEVEKIVIEQEDTTPLPTEDNLKGLVMEKEGDNLYSVDNTENNNNSIRTKLFTTLSSLFQMVCLFLVTRMLLSLFFPPL